GVTSCIHINKQSSGQSPEVFNRNKFFFYLNENLRFSNFPCFTPRQASENSLIKGSSSKWINEQNFSSHKFAWQGGYGAFSYSRSQLPTVINYIKRQKEHHKKRSFRQEYIAFLEKFDVDYDERYIFNEPA